MEQASSSTQLTVIDIVELLDKPLLGTLVAVLAGEHDAIPSPKHGKSRGKNPVAERLLRKGHYWEVSSFMMRDPAIWRIPSFTRMMRLRRIARRQTSGRSLRPLLGKRIAFRVGERESE
jgi:hypothetical protein